MRAPNRLALAPAPAAAALGLAFLCLYAATLQTTLYGDGVFYLAIARDTLEGAANPVGHHPLYLPLLTAAARLGAFLGLDLVRAGALFSALTGAAGVALCFPLFLSWIGRPLLALFGVLVLGLAPTTWFFATTTENHSLHFFLVVLLLLGLTRAARARSPIYLLLPGLLWVPAFLAHTTALMLAPFLALAFLVLRAEAGLPPPWRSGPYAPSPPLRVLRALLALGLFFGPVLLARLLLPALYTWLNRGVDPFHGVDPTAATLQADVFPRANLEPGLAAWLFANPLRLARYTFHHAPEMARHVGQDWLFHSALAGLLFLAGLALQLGRSFRHLSPWPLLGLLALLPYAWLFSFWGFHPVEKGAYYLPILPPTLAVGLLGLLLLPRPSPRLALPLLALPLLAGQALLARSVVSEHARSETHRAWAQEVSALVHPPGAPLGVALTGDGFRLYHLRLFHPKQLGAFRFEELDHLAPTEILRLIQEHRSWRARIFLDDQFLEKSARKRPDLDRALRALPWTQVSHGRLRGLLLGEG